MTVTDRQPRPGGMDQEPGMVTPLPSPHPLAETLPSILRADAFASSLADSFDGLLAPAILALDTLVDYLDPQLTPEDMLPWLAQWHGISVDESAAHTLHRDDLDLARTVNPLRGTRRSLELVIEATLGVPAEVTESGVAAWTFTPGGELPGDAEPSVTVVLRPPSGVEVDMGRLDALLESVTPAHVRRVVSVVT